MLISRFEDTNLDGVPSAGDTVITNQYPLSLDPITGFGDFNVTSHTVDNVVLVGPSLIWVDDAAGNTFIFGSDAYTEFAPTGPASGHQVRLLDSSTGSVGPDIIQVEAGAPSDPTVPVSISGPNGSDDFIDVDF